MAAGAGGARNVTEMRGCGKDYLKIQCGSAESIRWELDLVLRLLFELGQVALPAAVNGLHLRVATMR